MLKENLENVEQKIQAACERSGRDRSEVTLIAVSKTKPAEMVQEAYDLGIRLFGENKVQELLQKYPALPDDIEWHFIGHLQRNKVKMIVPFISLIHSIDSPRLLAEVNNAAVKVGRVVDCLLQIHIAREETKYGFSIDECDEFLRGGEWTKFDYIRFCGVMGMATFTDDETEVREEFETLKQFFDRIKMSYFPNIEYFKEISMGMSEDYPIAIKAGSSMIRVGSYIFGPRIY